MHIPTVIYGIQVDHQGKDLNMEFNQPLHLCEYFQEPVEYPLEILEIASNMAVKVCWHTT